MKAKLRFKDDQRGLRLLERRTRALDGQGVEVVVEGEHAEVAVIQEFGTDTIPARPFFRTALELREAASAKALARGAGEALDGGSALPDLAAEGEALKRAVQDSIEGWVDPPNAPATVAKKRRNDPLVETGEMKDGVTWRLVTRGGSD